MEQIEHVSDAEAATPARDVARALAMVRERIEQACEEVGRNADEISVLAVTKGFGPEAIEAAIAANIAEIGENYYQEAQAKFERVRWAAPDGTRTVRRHFIGPVQSNKARKIASLFDVVQTVDDASIARSLDRGAAQCCKTLDVLIQLNIAHDQRHGAAAAEAVALASTLRQCEHLRLRGVMAIGPLHGDSYAAFAEASGAYRELASEYAGVDTLSLGMTDDLEAAVAAGTTMVRIGTALFGPRPMKGKG